MAINPMKLMKLMSFKKEFESNHPKLPMFLSAVKNEIAEGTVIEVSVKSPEGREMMTNIKVTASDLKIFQELKELAQESR